MTTTMWVAAIGGAGILTVAWVTTASLRRASASLRHAVWLAAVTATLALPVLEMSGLQLTVSVPATLLTGVERVAEAPRVLMAPPADAGPSAPAISEPAAQRAAPGTGLDTHDDPERAASRGEVSTAAPGRHVALSDGSGPVLNSAEPPAALPAGPADRAAAAASLPFAAIALAIWLLGVVALLTSFVVSHVRARSLVRRDVREPGRFVSRRLAWWTARLGLDTPVRLVVGDRVRVPAACGLLQPTIVLPAAHDAWSPRMLDRVLLHELAHIRRRDCLANVVGGVVRALHWPNPLAWYALNRLRAESERACDDEVIGATARPSDYAGDLVSMARSLTRADRLPGAVLAMAQPTSISGRVRAILDPRQRRGPARGPAVAVIAFVALGLAVSATMVTPVADAQEVVTVAERASPTQSVEAAPVEVVGSAEVVGAVQVAGPLVTAQERVCVFREGGRRSMSSHFDDDGMEIEWETDDCKVEIDVDGHVEFSGDDQIVALGPGDRFEIEQEMGRSTRRARLEGRSDGTIERRYWEDREEIPWGPEADRWLAQILPEIFRHSTINAENRVRRMVEEGGPDRVFDEVAIIESDHVSRRYLEILMDVADLSERDYIRVIEAAADIESDHAAAMLLMAVLEREGLRDSFQDPILGVAETIGSDWEKTRLLRVLLESELSPTQVDAVLRSASTIESDHNLMELLSSLARNRQLSVTARASYLDAVRSIQSDHSQAMVLHALLESGRLDDDEVLRLLEMTEGIGSDHENGEVLRRVAREYSLSGPAVTAFLRSLESINSDHQLGMTGHALVEHGELDDAQVGLVLEVAGRIRSNHERGSLLVALAQRHALEGEHRDRYEALAAELSRHEREQALRALRR